MSQPTIDEMLEWLHQVRERIRVAERIPYLHRPVYVKAIRAILEQHRHGMFYLPRKRMEREAIRAFVERVKSLSRYASGATEYERWGTALEMEWATLEEEAEVKE